MALGLNWQIGMIVYLVVFFVLGMAMFYFVKGSGKQYIIAGKSLPFFLVGTTMLAQSLDANATMGNAAQTYSAGFWAGFQFPLGLALCLVVTGTWYAKPLNRMQLITLPDFYYRRYNGAVEVLVGLAMSFSFIILLAGNISGGAWILSHIFGWNYLTALVVISLIVFFYTIAGGLWSVVATDITQAYPAIIGFVAAFLWLLFTYGWDFFSQAIPPGHLDLSGLTDPANGAYLNWAGILALGLGDVVALDFMERVFASKSPETARRACYYGAGLTLVTGIAASFMGLMALELVPEVVDPRMVMSTMATENLPFILGLMIMGGIVGAGLSTADGGLLGVSSVFGRNILQRNILQIWKKEYSAADRRALDRRLLIVTRLAAIPIMAGSIYMAIVRPEPGILLVLAFDVVFAGCLVPLTLGLYWKKANTPGALAAFIIGSLLRLYLYYNIPEHLAGLDTLIPPVVSLIVMVPVSLMTQTKYPPKHGVVDYVPTEEQVLSTEY
ncbi:MAG: sodium:solute symporter family protein [Desulfobacterales bacterium]|nr:MAG: sodium:solute symporter family protein [Desulfobacterales bacterium]